MDWWLISAVLGALSGAWVRPDWPLWPCILLTAMWLIVGYIFPAFRSRPGFRSTTLICTGLLCGILWAVFNARLAFYWTLPLSDYREARNVKVKITEIVQKNELRWRIDGRLEQGPENWSLATVALLRPHVRLSWYQQEGEVPKLGEIWDMEVRLRPPTALLNQGSFNYQAYLVRRNIRATGTVLQAQRDLAASFSNPRQYIYEQYLSRRSALDYGGVILALVLGERHWLENSDWHLLQRTGVAHLMAISGLHLSMVFATSWWLARFLLGCLPGRRRDNLSYQAIAVAWLIALAYAALAGFAVATMRALLLITLAVGYRLFARRINAPRLLLRVLAVVLIFDPLAWLDTGFWLSFAAVFAIFVWLWRLPDTQSGTGWRHSLRQLWRLEIMLTVLLWPMTALFFQGVSLVAPLTNMLVIPLFSAVVLPSVLIATLLLLLRMPGANWLLMLADTILAWLWQILALFATSDWNWLNARPWLFTLLLFAALLSCYWPARRRVKISMALAFGSAALWWFMEQRADDTLWLHILDVGQGSAAVIQRGQRAIIVDAGPRYRGGFDLGEAVVVPFLMHRGLRPDYLILSHPHQDHTGGAEAIQQAFPSVLTLDTTAAHWPCEWGQAWHWQGVQLHALAPLPGPSFGPNNDSCVVQLHYQGQRILLPGDMERITEFRLRRRYGGLLRSEVLVVPHHGSRTSSGEPILTAIGPEIALVSRGYLNRFEMPHEETIARLQAVGAAIYDTGVAGQITLKWSDEGWQVKTYRAHLAPYWFNQI